MRKWMETLDAIARKLLAAMSACAHEDFLRDLVAVIGDLDELTALGALQQLIARSLAEEVSRTDRRYRLHAMVREGAGGKALGRQHAEAVRERYDSWGTNWQRCEENLPDLRLAL